MAGKFTSPVPIPCYRFPNSGLGIDKTHPNLLVPLPGLPDSLWAPISELGVQPAYRPDLTR